jgi:hypothetical protein
MIECDFSSFCFGDKIYEHKVTLAVKIFWEDGLLGPYATNTCNGKARFLAYFPSCCFLERLTPLNPASGNNPPILPLVRTEKQNFLSRIFDNDTDTHSWSFFLHNLDEDGKCPKLFHNALD